MSTGSTEAISEHEVLGLERAAIARWCRGDPSGFLDISDVEVGYFDPFLAHRIDGLAALTTYYESLRGTISAVAWEVLEPRVVEIDEIAILTFRIRVWGESGESVAWNCSEVFRRRPVGWRIAQTHWSLTTPDVAD